MQVPCLALSGSSFLSMETESIQCAAEGAVTEDVRGGEPALWQLLGDSWQWASYSWIDKFTNLGPQVSLGNLVHIPAGKASPTGHASAEEYKPVCSGDQGAERALRTAVSEGLFEEQFVSLGASSVMRPPRSVPTQGVSMLEIAPDISIKAPATSAVFFLLVQPGGCSRLWL